MKILYPKSIVIVFLLFSIAMNSQTFIEGILVTDTILQRANSPFIIPSTLTVADDVVLSIESGVELRFDLGVTFEIIGTVQAIGSSSDTIKFVSAADSSRADWHGIQMFNEKGAKGFFEYCKFSNALVAIEQSCCDSGSISISNCFFMNNEVALGRNNGLLTYITNCVFRSNHIAISDADWSIENTDFKHNAFGLFRTIRCEVINSVFTENTEVAISMLNGYVQSCHLFNNNIGIRLDSASVFVDSCDISLNDIGIRVLNEAPFFVNSTICQNSHFNIENLGIEAFDVFGTCWCGSDSLEIEHLLYDGDDDVSVGEISYDVLNGTCDSIVRRVDKSLPKRTLWKKVDSPISICEDYKVNAGDTLIIEPGVVALFDTQTQMIVEGCLFAMGQPADTIIFKSKVDSSDSDWKGIILNNDTNNDVFINSCKFQNAQQAIYESCCADGFITIQHSNFENNKTGIAGGREVATFIEDCLFKSNHCAATDRNKEFYNVSFVNNDFGFYETTSTFAFNSSFSGHTEAAVKMIDGYLQSCMFNNNDIAVELDSLFIQIDTCIITNNRVGLKIINEPPILINSEICGNSEFNLENRSESNFRMYGTCWCTEDSALIENKIYDQYDDPSVGLVDYSIFELSCDEQILITSKEEGFAIFGNLFSNNCPKTSTFGESMQQVEHFGNEVELTITSGTNVQSGSLQYKANEFINLLPGFSIQNGATFVASNQGCQN